ncbi:MAG: ribosome biogenesis GTP-binding protein YsxC [Gemmatimonadetes bacterium]|nr:ribosome biogenesis GTP-binding protein YsxC [Gemmatimonadota bacterium]
MSTAAVPAEVSPLARLPIEFLGSFPDPMHRLDPVLPEFAMIGRSNVGKSSLLNALVGRRSLARVSQTPGKTQLLNIYQLPSLYLIDLPGYGFAQADKGTRLAYRKLLESFLRKRTTLTGVVWLLDIRHKPSKDDGDFHTLLTDSGCAVLAVLTKADKLTRSGRAKAAAERADAIGFPLDQVQVVSAETGLGIAELGASLLAAAMEPITPEPAA